MLRVYIAGPISKGNKEHNYNQAVKAFYDLMDAGIAAYCPHLLMPAHAKIYGTVSGRESGWHERFMANDLEWVKASNMLLRLRGESEGADEEVAYARGMDIPVFYSVEDLIAATS